MTRRERLERKLEKREEWAQGREREAKRRFAVADKDAEAFYGGQPILVGHHSEKRARALQEKIHRNGFAGVDNMKMAEHHRDKAAGLASQLENTIFSDDPDAVEAIEAKIADLESWQSFMVAVNKIVRNKKLDATQKEAQFAAFAVNEDDDKLWLHKDWKTAGFQSWALSNNSANIRRYKDRLEAIKARKLLLDRAEASESGVVIDRIYGGKVARITFSEKPEREIINALKAAGFRWNKCCWVGDSEKIPSVQFECDKTGE